MKAAHAHVSIDDCDREYSRGAVVEQDQRSEYSVLFCFFKDKG